MQKKRLSHDGRFSLIGVTPMYNKRRATASRGSSCFLGEDEKG